MEKIKIFSGRSHKKLATKICQKLNTKLSQKKIEPYANGCFEVIFQDKVKGCRVFLIQTSASQTLHQDLWELFQMVNSAQRNGAREVVVIMPYVSYARSDKIKIDSPGMTISGELLVKLLEASGMTRFIGINFHSKEFEKFFSEKAKVYHLSALPLIARRLERKNLKNTILLAGDKGAFGNASSLAEKLSIPAGYVDKTRISGRRVKVKKINIDVTGRNVILFDDEISPAATTVRTIGKELEKRGVNSLIVAVTHASIVQKTARSLKALKILKEIIATDTVPIFEEVRKSLPLRILSVADLIATEIKEISKEP